jgi:hypothetical protein
MRRWLTMVALMVVIGGPGTPRHGVHAQTQPRSVSLEESKLRGFIVTLILGEIAGGKTGGTFTPAATKALADLKDFLPYKSYRLLDTVWTLGLDGPHQFLRGPDGEKHEFGMRSSLVSATQVKVDMLRLWDVPPRESEWMPPGMMPPPLLIDTDFKLTVGETVVVGTSRLDSTRGLILLVTAAPK